MPKDIIKLNEEYRKLIQQTEHKKKSLISEINKIIKPIWKYTINNFNDIYIHTTTIDKNYNNLFKGLQCIVISETDKWDKYSQEYVFPISFLKIKNEKILKKTFKDIKEKQKEIEIEEKTKYKKEQKTLIEKNEKKEYKRLKRKFNKLK